MKQTTPIPLAAEPLFRRLLSLERRRCERSEGRFGLLLVDLESVRASAAAPDLERVASAIAAAMRETDITGWYEEGSTIGVILTELNETKRETLEAVVVERTKCLVVDHLGEMQGHRVRISCHLFPDDDVANHIFYSEENQSRTGTTHSMFLKRAIDVAGSLAALILLSPLFVVIAALIKLTSEGPIFFRQKRIGQFGGKFIFLKFRSMIVNNNPEIHRQYVQNLITKKVDPSAGAFKIKNDPRVTRIGRFLRKSSLDELPQFLNVLCGEMSLVGPRPPIPYEFENYLLWHRRRVLEVKPGITGEWQVFGRSRTTFDEMVRMDLRYIQNRSIWLDLKILFKTPLAVISGDGAY
ncbi:MAG TPA: sugar transferase [Terriglobia bacterium]|jgi:lipopolysaccharide/colanic/teichoic acid biosynthesis glycosyltransferase